MTPDQPPLIIYHGGCRDGFCAAWVAHRMRPGAEFFPASFGEDPPSVTGRKVYLLDFSYPRKTLLAMVADAKSVLVLDHHRTAEADLKGLPFAIFDMQRSGAGLAWQHFYGVDDPSDPLWLVRYVEDRDLWRHALPWSAEVNAYIATLPFEFGAWDDAAAQFADEEAAISWARDHGATVLAKTEQYVREVAKNAIRIDFEGYNVPLVNAPQVDISELVAHLAAGEKFAMGWWQRADGMISYSLRSSGDDPIDVSELAKRHGGGGHKQAAGFQLREPFHLAGGTA